MIENQGRPTIVIWDVLRTVPLYFGLAISGIGLLVLIQYFALPSTPGWQPEAQVPSVRITDFSATAEKVCVSYLSRPTQGAKSIQPRVAIFELAFPESVWHLPIANPVCFKFSPAGDRIAVADKSGCIYLTDTEKSEKPPIKLGHSTLAVQEIFWPKDESTLLTRTAESVLVWSVLEGKILLEIPVDSTAEVHVPNRTDYVVIGCNGLARVYDLSLGVVIQSYSLPANSRSLLLNSDLSFLICLVGNNVLMLASQENGSFLATKCKAAEFIKTPIAISPDEKHLAMIEHTARGQFICNIREVSTQSVVFSQTLNCPSVGGIQFTNNQTLWIWNYDGSADKYEFEVTASHSMDETTLRKTNQWFCLDSRRPPD